MKHAFKILSLIAVLAAVPAVHADTLLIERAQEKPAQAIPARGQSMSEVEARFGAPSERMDPRGGQKRDWPTINRWVYPQFTVYFQRDRVLDVVANKASATEVGPAPPVR